MNEIMLIRNGGETDGQKEIWKVESRQMTNQMTNKVSVDPESYDKHLMMQMYAQ